MDQREHREAPLPRIVAAVIMHEGKVLVVHNVKKGVRIEPPGGKVEENETPEQAVVRETKEELNIIVRIVSLLDTSDSHTPEGTFEVLTYLCDIEEGEPEVLEPHKHARFEWMTPSAVRALAEKAENDTVVVANLITALDSIEKTL